MAPKPVNKYNAVQEPLVWRKIENMTSDRNSATTSSPLYKVVNPSGLTNVGGSRALSLEDGPEV